MIISIKDYVSEPFDVFHQIFATSLLSCFQSCKHYCLFSMKVLSAKYIHHVIPCWD